MALSEKFETLEKEVNLSIRDIKKLQHETVEILYNMLYGMAIKVDILQAIVLETISELPDEVKVKVLNKNNLERISAEATEGYQKRLDMMGWGDRQKEAPMDQLLEDAKRADVI